MKNFLNTISSQEDLCLAIENSDDLDNEQYYTAHFTVPKKGDVRVLIPRKNNVTIYDDDMT